MKMRLKVWMLSGLLLLVTAVWLFWPRDGAAPVVANSAPAPAAVVASATAPTAQAGVPQAEEPVSRSAASTNRLAYRLTNTTKSLSELVTSPRAILLENALVDTAAGLRLNIPPHLQASSEPGAYIVQARGPVDAAFRSALAGAGAQVVSYIPNNAYLVQMSGAGAAVLSSHALVQAVLPYAPYFKVQASLLGLAVKSAALPAGQALTLGLFANGAAATEAQIEKLGLIVGRDRSPFGPVVRVVPTAGADWLALAQLSGVQRVEPSTHRQLANDLARVTMGLTSGSMVTNENWMGLNGSNVLLQVNDTGVDAGHPDFTTGGSATTPGDAPSRVIGNSTNSLQDVNGHGTHVVGIIMGNGAKSYSVGSVPSGSETNADFRGKAPAAKVFSVRVLGDGLSVVTSDAEMQALAALTNALIVNNSWTYGVNEYDLSAASYDAAVRDSLPEVTGPQPISYVFAAGNTGQGGDSGIGGVADSIMSPGTAKNVITVGAQEQYRDITNEVVSLEGETNAIWTAATDSSSQVADYSSRGNVGLQVEGDFGRFKPDVVAPGTFVVSTAPAVGMWDKAGYYTTTNYNDGYSMYGMIVTSNRLIRGGGIVPPNGAALTIRVRPNSDSPVPFPTNFPIYLALTGLAGPSNNVVATSNNELSIPPGGGSLTDLTPLLNNSFSCAVGNPTNISVSFDLIIRIATTNDTGNQTLVLSNLNESIGPYYRYASGTSMSAPAVSGTLALMRDFFVNQRNPAYFTNPSPALLKAMLINGARLSGGYPGYALTNNINYAGWGVVQVSNSLPVGLTNTASGTNGMPVFLLDQSPTNGLATGDRRTYNVSVPTVQARNQNLRFTLAWTDPAGNPAAGLKLVNNLDLIVTNLDDGRVYYGNVFGGSALSAEVSSNTVPDVINNVENITLGLPAGTNYSVTVLGRNVAVNAVTTEQTNVVQDFALVITSGEGNSTNGIQVTAATPSAAASIAPQITYVSSYTNGIYFNQIAGANAPWLSTNGQPIGSGFGTNATLFVGQTNQWHFYVITNTTTYTNAAFVIFVPQTESVSRMGVFADSEENATRLEADLNLFVASAPDAGAGSLTNLNLTVISNCVYQVNGDQSALGKGGTKFIVYSNAQPNQVYYIGVQCQDQLGGLYGFLSVFSPLPFSTLNSDGSQTVNGLSLPVAIPDGSPAHGGVGYVFGLAIMPMEIRDVTVTNSITHENYGDLIGILSHGGTSVVLNNHDGEIGSVVDYTTVYNDDGLLGTVPVDGPGTLRSYKGKEAVGPWFMTQVDDSQFQTGSITGFSLNIQPQQDLAGVGVTVDVPPQGWWYGYVDVPVGYTNLTVVATNITIPTPGPFPVQMYLNYEVEPNLTTYLVRADLTNGTPPLPPGNLIAYGPPLKPGRYFVGLYNPNIVTQKIFIRVKLAFDASAITQTAWNAPAEVPLLDDAVSYAYLSVDDTNRIEQFSVGLRVNHERISDLVFHLISPDGTRYLLMENRGGQSTNGCGTTVVTTNIVNVNANGDARPATNTIDVGISSGTFPITYNFYGVPDQMTVYYGTNVILANQIYNTGMTNNGPLGGPYTNKTVIVNFPPPGIPANSTDLTIVMNQFGNADTNTQWTYTAGGVMTNYYYLTFTDETNLTTTPIKYALPPFVPVFVTNVIVQTNSLNVPTNVSVLAGPILNTNNNHYYYLLQTNDWFNSEALAVSMGGHLTSIDDANENVWVYNQFAVVGGVSRNLWIGLVDTNNDTSTVPAIHGTNFFWINGSLSTYRNWRLGEPNNIGITYHTYMYGPGSGYGPYVGQWNDDLGSRIFDTGSHYMSGVVEIDLLVKNTTISTANLYYQPEDSLENLIGTNPHGQWTLETLDNRAGATNNASLVSWQLNFTFANTNFATVINTNIGLGPITNYIPGGALQWYLVNVPTNASIATNSLLFATLPLQMWWSTNVPPTITNTLADVLLLGNSTGGSVELETNSSPALVPGGSYFLGIQNTNVGGATYALEVTFHLTSGLFSGPTVLTQPATNVVTGAATLRGLVTPNSTNTTVYFQYGLDTNYLSGPSASVVLSSNYSLPQGVAIGITNLAPPGAVYYFRAVGYNVFGTNFGADLTFTNPLPPGPAYAFTMPATRVNGSSAQLNGMATPNGGPAQAWFEWGTSPAYTSKTTPVDVGAGLNVVYVTNQISGLTTNWAYHCRLVVSNALGLAYGADQVFAQGSVLAWGAAFFGQTTPIPASLTNLVAGVGAGFDFSLALNFDGTVVAWGDGTSGQTTVPAGLNNAVAVAGGYRHSLALRGNRTVTVWGSNSDGQANVPPNLTDAVAAASGAYYCLALRENGRPLAWGQNDAGQTNIPAGLSNVVAVAAGYSHSLALKHDGTVAAWGNNANGQTFVPVGLTNVVAIAAGYYDSLALKKDGTVVAWGYNANGQTNVPSSLNNVTAIAAGGYHCLALKGDGSVWLWGDSSSGQANPYGNPWDPYQSGLTNVFAIAGGGFHTLAVKAPFGLNVTNLPPYWANGLNGTTNAMDELAIQSINNAALDSNAPPQLVFYSLANPPSFAAIDSFSGLITLDPSETNGPGTYNLITVATDNGYPPLSATNRITLVVNEVNLPPYWTNGVPASTNYTIGVGQTLTVINTAVDPDLPVNPLTYTNFVSPLNATPAISASGVMTWTPSAAGNFTLTTIVTDFSASALTNQSLSATNYITVTVTNVPTPPASTNIDIASIVYTNNGFLLTWYAPSNDLFQVQCSTNLSPLVWLTFTNIISYNPSFPADATNATFTFFDDGSQIPFGGTRFYQIIPFIPTGSTNTAPVLPVVGAQTVNPLNMLVVTNTATDTDVPTQSLTYVLTSTVTGTNLPVINPATGVIQWTPDVTQAGTSNTITTIVTDSGVPPLSTTNSFVVQVNPVPDIGSVIYTNGVFLLTWLAPTNDIFQVQFADNLTAPNWQSFSSLVTYTGPVVTTNGMFSFIDDGGEYPFTGLRFYRIILVGVIGPVSPSSNTVPVLPVVGAQTVNPLSMLVVSNTATDIDVPAQSLTYALTSTVAGTNLPVINPATGVIQWTPEVTQAGTSNTFTTIVTDSGVPPLSATNHVVVVVNPVPDIGSVIYTNGVFLLTWLAPTNDIFQVQCADNLSAPNWQSFSNLVTYTGPAVVTTNGWFNFTDDGGEYPFTGLRFYRIILVGVGLPASPPPLTNTVSISSIIATNGNFLLTWSASTTNQFNVQWSTNLVPPVVWTSFTNPITSTNGSFNFTDTNTPLLMKFYQLILLP